MHVYVAFRSIQTHIDYSWALHNLALCVDTKQRRRLSSDWVDNIYGNTCTCSRGLQHKRYLPGYDLLTLAWRSGWGFPGPWECRWCESQLLFPHSLVSEYLGRRDRRSLWAHSHTSLSVIGPVVISISVTWIGNDIHVHNSIQIASQSLASTSHDPRPPHTYCVSPLVLLTPPTHLLCCPLVLLTPPTHLLCVAP